VKDMDTELLSNIDNIHTTELGLIRIKRNLGLSSEADVIEYCKKTITKHGVKPLSLDMGI